MSGGVRPLIGDLFASDAQTLVNTVNTVGIMGKGIALEFKKRYPDMFKEYVRKCERGEVALGRPYLYASLFDRWVLNFPTKDHWRSRSKLDDIVAGLEHLERHYEEWGITSLAVPPLGCGEGGLEWRVVGPTLYRHLSRLRIPVELYAPFGTPAEELEPAFLAGEGNANSDGRAPLKVSPAAVALVEILARIHSESYHWPTGRISFQKIAYFATVAGIPTGLEYVQGSFGPFAPRLKQIQSRLENNGLLVERRSGQMFLASPGPTFEDARRVYAPFLTRWSDQINRVVDLLLRFDTRKMEVAASAHFAASVLATRHRSEPSELDVFAYVMDWKKLREPPLHPADVATAVRHLNALGWVHATPSAQLPLPQSEETALA